MKRMMGWTPTPSHLMKQMPRKRGPRHEGLESTKWNDEISYLGSEKLYNVIQGYFPGASFCFSDMWKSIIWLLQGGVHPNIYIKKVSNRFFLQDRSAVADGVLQPALNDQAFLHAFQRFFICSNFAHVLHLTFFFTYKYIYRWFFTGHVPLSGEPCWSS